MLVPVTVLVITKFSISVRAKSISELKVELPLNVELELKAALPLIETNPVPVENTTRENEIVAKYVEATKSVADYSLKLGSCRETIKQKTQQLDLLMTAYTLMTEPCRAEIDSLLAEFAKEE